MKNWRPMELEDKIRLDRLCQDVIELLHKYARPYEDGQYPIMGGDFADPFTKDDRIRVSIYGKILKNPGLPNTYQEDMEAFQRTPEITPDADT